MHKVIIAFFSVSFIFINSGSIFAIPPSLRFIIKESAELPKLGKSIMTSSTLKALKGSKPIKPLSEAPFEKVGSLFNRPVQFLDNSGEIFRRDPFTYVEESFTPKLEQVDNETVRVDLKKNSSF